MSTASGAPAAKKAAARARKAEAKPPADITFTYDGIGYKVSRDNANDLDLMEDLEDEKYLKAIRGFLGADQWTKFKDSQRGVDGRVSMESVEPFLNALLEAIGQGNSSASSTS